MCIENEKVFNFIRVPIAVFLICISSIAELAVYWLLELIPLMIFPILTVGLFATILLRRNNVSYKRLATFIYLGFIVCELGLWAYLAHKTFYVDEDGKKECADGVEVPEEGFENNGKMYIDFDDCYAEQDMQIAVKFLIVLVIVAFKGFFTYVMWYWYKQLKEMHVLAF